ncbi:MAG: tetratricopeptide repeat protein [Bacteroidota bacterium]
MKYPSNFDKIIAYVEGDMSSGERASFEKELAENNTLKKEFELFKQTDEAVDFMQYEHVRKTIKSFEKPGSRIVPFWRRPLAVAASVLLVLAASFFIYSTYQFSNNNLADRYYSPPNFSELRSNEITSENVLLNASSYINQGKYSEASMLLLAVESTSPQYIDAKYMLGHLHFSGGDIADAIDHFKIVQDSNDTRYAENAEWQLALCYLKTGDEQKCRQELEKILTDKSHAYYSDATSLKKNINSFFRKISF